MKDFLLCSLVFLFYGLQYERIAGTSASAIRLGIGILFAAGAVAESPGAKLF
jgi:hypothetical protein